MMRIPLLAVPSQTLALVLEGRACTLDLRTMGARLFCNMDVDGAVAWRGAVCLDRVDIRPAAGHGLPGTLFFVDALGTSEPVWTGLGDRFALVYAASDEAFPPAVLSRRS